MQHFATIAHCSTLVLTVINITDLSKMVRVCHRGVMVKAMVYRIVISEFEFQSRYYVHSQPNTLGKDKNPLILPAMG